jgi:hypothetical protein
VQHSIKRYWNQGHWKFTMDLLKAITHSVASRKWSKQQALKHLLVTGEAMANMRQ